MNRIFKTPYLKVTVFSVLLAACGQTDTTNEDTNSATPDSVSAESKDRLEKARNLFYSFPSPLETADMIRSSGAEFDKAILNSVDKVSKYTTNYDRALNLGVYGTDLCLTNVFGQKQETFSYMKCANELSNGLGIGSAFGEEIASRIESNKENKDSLMFIISDAFLTADMYLKSNDRVSLSALVITGAWIEGLYVSANIAESAKSNKEIIQRIADQRKAGIKLLKFINSFGEDESLVKIKAQVEEINEAFATLKQASKEKEKIESKEDAAGVLTLGSKEGKKEFTLEQVKPVIEKVKKVRSEIIM